MSISRRLLAVAASSVIAGSLALAAPANAANHDVRPGQSIQAAIDAAKPGDSIYVHPGVYHENVAITKDNLTLRGAGGGQSVLAPPAHRKNNACVDPSDPTVNGFCVVG